MKIGGPGSVSGIWTRGRRTEEGWSFTAVGTLTIGPFDALRKGTSPGVWTQVGTAFCDDVTHVVDVPDALPSALGDRPTGPSTGTRFKLPS